MRPLSTEPRRGLLDDLRVALVPWVVARVLVITALLVAREVVDTLDASRPLQLDQGLLSWDAAFYADIAQSGYDAVPDSGLRFFPFLPLAARLVAALPGVDTDLGLLIVANAAALLAGALLHRLVLHETGDAELARRSVWLGALAPQAITFVLGYAESLLVALSVACFLGLRTRRFGWAAAAGFAAGLVRPLGVLLVVPAALEALRGRRSLRGRRAPLLRLLAVGAPVAGMAAYFLWVWDRTDDFFYALDVHTRHDLRGPTVDPFTNLAEAVDDLVSGDHVGSGLHFLTAVALVVLVVRVFALLPPSYGMYAAVVIVTALTADNLSSLERYALSTFPLVIAAASFIGRPAIERAVLTASAGGLVAVSIVTFTGVVVP